MNIQNNAAETVIMMMVFSSAVCIMVTNLAVIIFLPLIC